MDKLKSNHNINTIMKKINNSKKRENRNILLNEAGYVNLREARKGLNMKKAKADELYEQLRLDYNEQVEEAQKARRARIAKEKRHQDKTYSFKKDLNSSLLDTKRFEKMFANEKDRKRPITVELISRVVANVRKTFNFKNYEHFMNWLNNEENELTKERQTGKENSFDVNEKNVFDKFIIKVLFLKGGSVWGENKKDTTRKIQFKNYNCKAFDPATSHVGDNNCGVRAVNTLLNTKLDSKKVRKELTVEPKKLLTAEHVCQIYKTYGGKKKLAFIDENYTGDFDMIATDYILFKDYHYTVITEALKIDHKEGRTKQKGKLTFDIETRPCEDCVLIGEQRAWLLKSAILSMVYQNNRGVKTKQTFTTDRELNCCQKFINWLDHEAKGKRYYNCVAHNGSRFDFYLLFSYLTPKELEDCNIQLRGTSIIGLQYKSHTFKDTCCYLTDSLKNLCDGYLITPEEKAFSKLSNIQVGDKILTNYQLCFYKPELSFWEFMDLEHNEPEFWVEYVKYCEYDCESLFLVWEKFKSQVHQVIESMGKWMHRYVSINTTNTIGSLAKKMLNATNGILRRGSSSSKIYKFYNEFIDNDADKYEFIKNFKRGGISHCNQHGWHREGICGVDIKSQYPAALINMLIPAGKSRWITIYEPDAKGYYLLKNIKWSADAKAFKPIASKKESGVLDWSDSNLSKCYVDSYMLQYLQEHCGLVSFDVIKGLVSDSDIEGTLLFGTYVNTLYKEKAQQDELKDAKDPAYNKPYREVVKLFLNSVTGKLVEDPSKYGQLAFYEGDEKGHGDKTINGTVTLYNKDENEGKINEWINAGVMVYSYSKRNLWDYINCLPNKADDVIHVETDGLYFGLPNKQLFIDNLEKLNHSMIKMGSELGNIEEDVSTNAESFWEGKKDYMIGDEYHKPDGHIDYNKTKIRFKGVPKTTIDDEGNTIDLLDKQFYIDRYNGKTVKKTFKTISKQLYDTKQTNNLSLAGFNMSRKSTPHNFKDFRVYEEIDGKVVKQPWRKYVGRLPHTQ